MQSIDLSALLLAGILSSFGELEHMHTGRAKFVPFDPEAKQPKMSYKVSGKIGHKVFAYCRIKDMHDHAGIIFQ